MVVGAFGEREGDFGKVGEEMSFEPKGSVALKGVTRIEALPVDDLRRIGWTKSL